jgi:sugar phosphate isomerase/epimerase
MDLCPGRIGVKADQLKTIELAAEYGFESVEPMGTYLVGLSQTQLTELQSVLSQKSLVWGAAGLSVEFRKDEAKFQEGLVELPTLAKALSAAGVTRVGTYIGPASDELTYLANFKQHTTRLRQIAHILGEHQLRLGLEYVGPRTSWTRRRYAFIHTLLETQELVAEIACDNLGVVLDSWHWYTAEEDIAALHALTNKEVVAVDLNDAPAGIPVQEQIDNRRELPMATGVIDLKAFLGALITMGYDGPVRAEPFNQRLNDLDDAAAVAQTATAMKNAFDLV